MFTTHPPTLLSTLSSLLPLSDYCTLSSPSIYSPLRLSSLSLTVKTVSEVRGREGGNKSLPPPPLPDSPFFKRTSGFDTTQTGDERRQVPHMLPDTRLLFPFFLLSLSVFHFICVCAYMSGTTSASDLLQATYGIIHDVERGREDVCVCVCV